MDPVREELVQTDPIADRYIEIGDEYRDRGAMGTDHQQLPTGPIHTRGTTSPHWLSSGVLNLNNQIINGLQPTKKKRLQVDSEHIAARQGYCQAQLALGDDARQADNEDDAIAAYQAILNLAPQYTARLDKTWQR